MSSASTSPRSYRLSDSGLVAGVAAGLAGHFGVPAWVFRTAFLLACFWKLSGGVAYALLWLLLSVPPRQEPIGLTIATAQGKRTPTTRTNWTRVLGWIGCFLYGIGVAWIISLYDTSLIGSNAILLVCAGAGMGLVWLTRDVAWKWGGRLALGILGTVVAWASACMIATPVIAQKAWVEDPTWNAIAITAVIMAVTVAMCLACAAYWLVHPGQSLVDRDAELVALTRAEMAAHLHDSVLQTLAVIQKSADDAPMVAKLARAQEKELRGYLYGDVLDEKSFKGQMRDVADEIEAIYPSRVELVTVGEATMTTELDALVRAAREAVVNAAKHSGADHIDVYAEVAPAQVEVFVRDRGKGFSMEDVDEDRQGIRRSIISRMSRFGGRASIRSTPGEGTEIHLAMPYDKENHV